MWSRLDYSRKLIGSLIIFIISILLIREQFNLIICIGGFLFFEHYFIWDRWDFYDFLIGHEWWGMYLITIGILITGMYFGLLIWVGFLVGATYNKSNPFKEFFPTIKEVFNAKK